MTRVLKNQIVAHNMAGDAWKYALMLINTYGDQVITEDRKLTKEIHNLQLCVPNPLEGWPIEGSGWNMHGLETYANQLLEFSYDCKGFDYMYNERMGRQVHYIVKHLKEHPTTRRATMYLWLPEKDLEVKGLHNPCQVVADYKFRDDRLQATHFFRSHDMKDAWPQNVYGLAKLQEMIATEAGMKPGSLTTISASGHIYID